MSAHASPEAGDGYLDADPPYSNNESRLNLLDLMEDFPKVAAPEQIEREPQTFENRLAMANDYIGGAREAIRHLSEIPPGRTPSVALLQQVREQVDGYDQDLRRTLREEHQQNGAESAMRLFREIVRQQKRNGVTVTHNGGIDAAGDLSIQYTISDPTLTRPEFREIIRNRIRIGR